MKQEDIDQIVKTIEDSVPVYEDVVKALEDKKITWLEGGELLVKHGGKAIRFIGSAKEIGQEIADLEPDEAEEVMDTIAHAYGHGDPKSFTAARHIVKGLAEIRTGLELLLVKEE